MIITIHDKQVKKQNGDIVNAHMVQDIANINGYAAGDFLREFNNMVLHLDEKTNAIIEQRLFGVKVPSFGIPEQEKLAS